MSLESIKELSDNEILELFKENKDKAFDEIFRRYWGKLYIYAIKILGNVEIGKDTVQEVFMDVWQRCDDVEIKNLNAYLYGAIRNQVSKNIRKMKFSTNHFEALNEEVSAFKADGALELKELELSINDSISKLPDRCREIFNMSRYQEYSHKEIAQKLGLSVATVDTQISRALKHLRTHLRDTTIILLILNLCLL